MKINQKQRKSLVQFSFDAAKILLVGVAVGVIMQSNLPVWMVIAALFLIFILVVVGAFLDCVDGSDNDFKQGRK